MNKKTYVLNTILSGVLGLVLLAVIFVRSFAPQIILLKLDMPNLVLISLAALLLDHYVVPDAKRCYICIPVFSAITFGLLTFAACFPVGEALKLAVLGGITFTAVTWLFSSMMDRLSSGPAAKAAPVISAMGLYLAAQCLMGIF